MFTRKGTGKSRDKPKDGERISSSSFLFGRTTAGRNVNEFTAMQMTAVYSCVRVLAETLAGLPLHLYKRGDSNSKEKAKDHAIYFLLHDEPNDEMTSFVFRETLMTHLLLWGNAYAQIIRNGRNEVIGLYPLMPNKMTVMRSEDGEIFYKYNHKSEEVYLLKEDVLHIPGLGFDGL
ncbi:phage portal protein, partial [Anaerococcus vaginalis]|uniref:phage portal protein n=1 Tax=Anaerococcus vaginalis TaxID=33037 RepID=UPI0036F490AB